MRATARATYFLLAASFFHTVSMRIPRVYTDQPLAESMTVTLDPRAGRHLGRVLRARRGDPVVLFNGDGNDYAGSVVETGRDAVSVRLEARRALDNETPLRVTLAQGIARGERMDYTLQKAVELGVSEIAPLVCERTEVKLSGKRLEKRIAHWRGVIANACEQSGRAVVPPLHPPRPLRDYLKRAPVGPRLVLRPDAERGPSALSPGERVTLLIGPEGGLSEREIDGARRAGFTPLRLGPRVLRTETAGPAALAALQALWGDMG